MFLKTSWLFWSDSITRMFHFIFSENCKINFLIVSYEILENRALKEAEELQVRAQRRAMARQVCSFLLKSRPTQSIFRLTLWMLPLGMIITITRK